MRGDGPPGDAARMDDVGREDDEFTRTPLAPGEGGRPGARWLWGRARPARAIPRRRWRRGAALPLALVVLVPLLLVAADAAPGHAAPAAPLRLRAGPWQRIGLQAADGRAVHTYAVSPADPDTLYACVGPLLGSAYPSPSGPMWAFRSRDAGATWAQLALPPLVGTWCDIAVASDAPGRIAVLAQQWSSQSSQRPACADTTPYLSGDGGDSWREIPHASVAPTSTVFASCTFWASAHHLYFGVTYGLSAPTAENANAWEEYSILERSDDGGRAWERADNGLGGDALLTLHALGAGSPYGAPSGDDTMIRAVFHSYPSPSSAVEIWQTQDAGRSWTHLTAVHLPSRGAVESIRPAGGAPIYVVTGDGPPSALFYTRLLQLAPGDHDWAQVSPLPVRGSAPERMGLLQVLGRASDGRAIALGVDPDRGVPPPGVSFGAGSTFNQAWGAQWIWVWDPRTARWGVVDAPLPVAEHSGFGCGNCWEAFVTRGTGPDGRGGRAPGMYIWLRDWQSPEAAAYRLFVPDAQPA